MLCLIQAAEEFTSQPSSAAPTTRQSFLAFQRTFVRIRCWIVLIPLLSRRSDWFTPQNVHKHGLSFFSLEPAAPVNNHFSPKSSGVSSFLFLTLSCLSAGFLRGREASLFVCPSSIHEWKRRVGHHLDARRHALHDLASFPFFFFFFFFFFSISTCLACRHLLKPPEYRSFGPHLWFLLMLVTKP